MRRLTAVGPGVAVICLAAGMARGTLASGEPAAESRATSGGSDAAPISAAPAAAGESRTVPKALAQLAQAPEGATAAPAPAEGEPPGNGSDRGIRWSGSGELLGWFTLNGSMKQPIFSRNSSNSDLLLTHVH